MKGKGSKSPHNPVHQSWISEAVKQLVNSPWFKTVDGTNPGTVFIITPMKKSARRYARSMKKDLAGFSKRLDVRTIEMSAGTAADVVLFDTVKSSSHAGDPHRLCVALTRAIQAEIVLLKREDSLKASGRNGPYKP